MTARNREVGILYRVGDSHPSEVLPANGRAFTLEELQKFVGGYIELVPGSQPFAYCNEEGRLEKLPVNAAASVFFRQVLVGDVIQVCKERL